MRLYVQKKILELISNIKDGVRYANSPGTTRSSGLAVLSVCNTTIISIDQSFQSTLSEQRYLFYKRMIAVLFRMLASIGSSVDKGKKDLVVSKDMENLLNRIYKELNGDSEVKLEIVFLPYKAAMWDSLESIWRAAKEDSRCDVYVIPIPYFEKSKDKDADDEFHYEGEDFPVDVPITHYSSYDITVRQPDIVYIHNPFDQSNKATMVHPNYFSYELKKHVNTLVYVPYYVSGGGISESEKYMLMFPVFHFMDKMVVQSDHYKHFYKEFIPEEKLLAFGSPKVDRIIYFEKHKPPIPKEWEDRIKDKKVIMYNVSNSSFYQHGLKVINKMIYVFSRFKERNDVVLLWRPHPLIEASLKSLNPSLLDSYLNLKEEFITNDIGIFDATPDITVSIALSDAYIGEDTSSLVHLFGVAGKPIFILNMDIDQPPTEDDITSVSFHDCYFEDETAWFVANGVNALCKMNLVSGKIDVIAKISANDDDSKHTEIVKKLSFYNKGQYCDVIKTADTIFILPMFASEICEYDIRENVLRKTMIPNSIPPNFDRMVKYNNSLYMKPKCYPAILEYEITTSSKKFHNKWYEEFETSDHSDMFSWGVCVRDNLLLMASSKVNKVLEFDLETSNSKVHIVGHEGINYFSMAFDGTDYWLVPNEGKSIIRWNYETGKTTAYEDYPEGFVGETRGFIGIVYCGTYMLAFPRETNMIVQIDINTAKMCEFKLNLPNEESEKRSCYHIENSQYYFAKKLDNTRIVTLRSYDNSLMIIDPETADFNIFKCRLNRDDVDKLVIKYKDPDTWEGLPYAYLESLYLSFDDFIVDYVISDKKHDQSAQKKAYSLVINNMDGTCGEKTHQSIKERMFQ